MTPNDVAQLVRELCDGDDNALHTLIEADDTILPVLMQQFSADSDGSHRAKIIEVIWQHRVVTTIPFLTSALHDSFPEVWRQALDGLVTIGGIESRMALTDFLADCNSNDGRSAWAAEAIEQIQV